MAESIDFVMPEFLVEATEEHYTQLALSVAPPRIDTAEGQMYYDHTKPTAIIAAEITQFHMPVALQMMFPQFATGKYLEWHGAPYQIFRRSATKATGSVFLDGKRYGQLLSAGTLVYTLGDDTEDAKEFRTTENVIIEEGGVSVQVEAVDGGVVGNSPALTVVAIQRGFEIDDVINPQPITGGVEAESDESLRERILSRIALAPLSGARRDYERWAKEVDGVGSVIVQPLWAGPQTVRVLITDSDNQIANQDLIEAVKEYIDPKEYEGRGEGQAPIGSIVTVDTIELVAIKVEAPIYFEVGADPAMTLERAKNNINRYLLDASTVLISEVGAVLSETDGVFDYNLSNLRLNDQSNNIQLLEGQRAVVGEVIKSAT